MGYYNNRKHYKNHHSGYSSGNHQTTLQKLLRGLVSVFTSVGFGLFWYALGTGIGDNALFFVLGIILMIIGIIHIFIGIKKDADYRNNNW